MARIPDEQLAQPTDSYRSQVAQLRKNVSILHVCAAHGIKLQPHGSTDYVGRCPLPGHRGDGPSFIVTPRGNRWRCVRCDRSGGIIDLVMVLDGLTFRETVDQLMTSTGLISRGTAATKQNKQARALILVESELDARSVERAGFPDVVALQSTNGLTAGAIAAMRRHGVTAVTLLLAGSDAGGRAAGRLRPRLEARGLAVTVKALPAIHTPSSYAAENGTEALGRFLASDVWTPSELNLSPGLPRRSRKESKPGPAPEPSVTRADGAFGQAPGLVAAKRSEDGTSSAPPEGNRVPPPGRSAGRERFRAAARHVATQIDIEETMWRMLDRSVSASLRRDKEGS